MNQLTNVYSIVPRLPPAIDGVGDYALNLARQLRKDFGIQTHFIVGNSTWLGASEIEGFPVSQVTNNSANALFEVLSDRPFPVLLHYVGYGYAKRGCPIWLVNGLQRWKSLYPQRSLVTMFHETYASGSPPWTSSFWLSPLQKSLAARLTQLSHCCITNNQTYANILIELSNGKHTKIDALPVFSNIGEPKKLLSWSERQKRLIIFGSVPQRSKVYQQSKETLHFICQILDIQEILDIGTPTQFTPQSIGEVPILKIGEQPATKISDIMGGAIAGFLNYDPNFLGKSTIFAAYCAHGMLSINATDNNLLTDQIISADQRPYWVSSTSQLKNIKTMQTIVNNASLWYADHDLSFQSKKFFHVLNTAIQ